MDNSEHYLIEHTDDLQLIKENVKDSYFTNSGTERYDEVEKIHRATGHKSDVSMTRILKRLGKVMPLLIRSFQR